MVKNFTPRPWLLQRICSPSLSQPIGSMGGWNWNWKEKERSILLLNNLYLVILTIQWTKLTECLTNTTPLLSNKHSQGISYSLMDGIIVTSWTCKLSYCLRRMSTSLCGSTSAPMATLSNSSIQMGIIVKRWITSGSSLLKVRNSTSVDMRKRSNLIKDINICSTSVLTAMSHTVETAHSNIEKQPCEETAHTKLNLIQLKR